MPNRTIDHDDYIIRMLASDDGQALTLLYKIHYPILRKVVFHILKNYESSDDVVQDLFMNIWDKRHSLRIYKPILKYLITAALNRARNHVRDRKRTREMYVDNFSDIEDSFVGVPADSKLSVDEIHKLWKIARSRMSEQANIILLLHRTQKFTYQEIADYLSLSNKTVEKHMSNAIAILKEVMKPYLKAIVFILMLQIN